MTTNKGFPKDQAEQAVTTCERLLPTAPASAYHGPELYEIGSLEKIQGILPQQNSDRINGYRQ